MTHRIHLFQAYLIVGTIRVNHFTNRNSRITIYLHTHGSNSSISATSRENNTLYGFSVGRNIIYVSGDQLVNPSSFSVVLVKNWTPICVHMVHKTLTSKIKVKTALNVSYVILWRNRAFLLQFKAEVIETNSRFKRVILLIDPNVIKMLKKI